MQSLPLNYHSGSRNKNWKKPINESRPGYLYDLNVYEALGMKHVIVITTKNSIDSVTKKKKEGKKLVMYYTKMYHLTSITSNHTK